MSFELKAVKIKTRVVISQPGLVLFRCCFLLFILLFRIELNATYTMQHRTGNLHVYAEESISGRLKESLSKLDERIDKMQMSLGLYTEEQAILYLVKDQQSFQRLTLGKDKIVEFSEAFYSGKENRIYIRPPVEIKESFTNTVMHEYIHWYLEQFLQGIPLWFHEGMAMQYSGQMGFERYLYFLQQSFLGQTSDLFRMSYRYPEKQEDWQIFYLSSSMAVRFMSDKKEQEWRRFWDIVSERKHSGVEAMFRECFTQAYRNNAYDFHRQFAAYIKKLRVQYLFWGINSILAVSLPLVVIVGFHQRRKRMAAMPEYPEPVDEEEDNGEEGD